jgi:hypothetical protein
LADGIAGPPFGAAMGWASFVLLDIDVRGDRDLAKRNMTTAPKMDFYYLISILPELSHRFTRSGILAVESWVRYLDN